MPSRDLRGFLVALQSQSTQTQAPQARLQPQGENSLARVRIPVSSQGEIAAVARHAEHRLNPSPALLFEQVHGSPFRLVANLTSEGDRMAFALHTATLDDIRTRVETLFDLNMPRGAMGMIGRMADLMEVARTIGVASNTTVRNPPILDHLLRDSPDIPPFPALTYHAQESHSSYTAAILIVRHRRAEISQYRATRAALIGSHTVAVRLDPDTYAALSDANEQAPLPAAVVLGTDPALLWSTDLPLPDGFDRTVLASWIRGRHIPQISGISQPVSIPADAEAVIEGVITGETIPVQWWNGEMLVTEHLYVMNVTAVAHRDRAIIPISVPGSRESLWSRRAAERLFLPMLKTVMPRLIDVTHLDAGRVIARVRASDQREMNRLGYGLWGLIPHVTEVILIRGTIDSPEQALSVTEAGARLLSLEEAQAALVLQDRSTLPVGDLPPLQRTWDDYGL